ncbi:MAG: amino acid adenylation domain-containing protein [Pseudotabrizicola sp.]|uniref:amino acid adenylation domain-containing protein n=1 Tax=Pseudotabrizicola sp. TaxID=2939647 RepID=UPI002724B3E0|nr:amino acid adenylation domain-containing protein [Pseudotabrizicola sp.]MDO9637831.1 amino acid adenylation domain-containing protein [Pseudotabrizicola sp.]
MTLHSQRKPEQDAALVEHALTPLQLGMVYESVLAGRPWVNLEQIVVHLDDELVTEDALRLAWAQVAARHEALRLSVLWRKRVAPVQVLRDRVEVALTVEDWSALPPRRLAGMLDQFLEADREQGVDLEAAPAWRVLLAHLGPRRSVMVWTVHHAMIDGRSMAIVLDEVFAALRGRALPPAPDAGFLAYATGLAAQDTAASEAFFGGYLADFDQPNPLTDVSDDSGMTRKRVLERRLDTALTQALSARAGAAGATLATMVQGAWGMVVARWTGRSTAVFGATRSGRQIVPGTTRTVGCLINTLPVKVQISPPRPTDAFLAELRRDALVLRDHEHAALTDIRRWCGLPGTEALFDSMVMFERASLNETMRGLGPDWASRRVELREEGAMPLTLAAYGDAGLLLMLEHDPVAVPAPKAQAMLDHMADLLAALAAAGAATPLTDLNMLSPPEQAALIALAQPDRMLTPADPCVALRFSEMARQRGNALALRMVGRHNILDYLALDARAEELAGRLVQAGAGPGQIVAICLPRGPEFIVAMLGILRAGAAFLPLDPTYPEALRAHMLTDSGTTLMIAPTDGDAAAFPAVRVLSPGAGAVRVPVPDFRPPDPDRLAYVIYTSGSTGVPKGVKVPMRALSAHASAMIAAFGLTQSDRVLQFASLSFDVSIEEIIPTLLAGAKLVLRSEAMAGSVGLFLDEVQRSDITVLNLPTAFWHVLVDEMARDGLRLPPTVRLVIVGGEQISPRALATWQRIAPGVRWMNGYGPTETTITCTLFEPKPLPKTGAKLVPPSATAHEDIPIGRPTAHARAYVLAPDGSFAPPGAPGALWIGGPAVSDGYIGHAAQTAEAFGPDRFVGTGRIYRTGDMARWRPDGGLAFLGRRDRQVKLRGFRIDLRHVERALERETGVGRALAHVLNAGTPAARLVVWVAGADGQPLPDAVALRAAVAEQLPPHMVPAIVPVSHFPRTPGGKVDISALPVPDVAVSAGVAASDDPVVQQIAGLMAQTLGLAAVGPDDDFHDLGGHSLLAVQLIGRIEAALGHRLGVADLHRRPTPRALARALAAAQSGPRYLIPIQPRGSQPPLFGVHVLGRNEEHFRPLAEALGPDQPVFGLTVGLLAQDTPIGVQDTARAYADEIMQNFPHGPISLAAVSLASYVAFDLAQQLIRAGREVRVIAMFDSAGPGGRTRLSGRARVGVHLRQLVRRGPSHLAGIVTNRWADVVYRAKKLRMRLQAGGAPMTVDRFMVAAEQAVQEYEVKPIYRPLTIFRAEANIFDSPESTQDGLGWAPVAASGFEVIDVPGDHLSILQPPNVAVLAHHLSRLMADLPEA